MIINIEYLNQIIMKFITLILAKQILCYNMIILTLIKNETRI